MKFAQKDVCDDLSIETANKQCIGETCASAYSDTSGCKSTEEIDDLDKDSDFFPSACEVKGCKEEVWAACQDCEILVCYDHCDEDIAPCDQHGKIPKKNKRKSNTNRQGKHAKNRKVDDVVKQAEEFTEIAGIETDQPRHDEMLHMSQPKGYIQLREMVKKLVWQKQTLKKKRLRRKEINKRESYASTMTKRELLQTSCKEMQ